MGIKGISKIYKMGGHPTKKTKLKKASKFTHKMEKNSLHIQLWVGVYFFHFDMNAK